MMGNSFDREFDAGRLEQLEAGVVMEYCERSMESAFEEEELSELLFGRMVIPERAEENDDNAPYGIADQLCSLGMIREIPFSDDFLPPCCGTSKMDIEYLLGMQEFSFESLHDAALADITEALAQESRVLCVVRAPGITDDGAPFLMCESNCLAEVCGIDLRDPDAARVSLRFLSGAPASWLCPLEEFMNAWRPCDNRCYIICQE